MSSFIMSKSETVVLFDLMGASSITVGIGNFPEVDSDEYLRIVKSFSDNHLIDATGDTFKPDKGLERFLLPATRAEKILLFNYGVNGSCSFNATLYFAKIGLVAVLEMHESRIKFLTIDSLEELLLFIPDITQSTPAEENGEPYISYVLLGVDSSIVHCTRIDRKKNIARVVEGKRGITTMPIEAEFMTDIPEYSEMLYCKLKEVYDAVGS